MQPRALVLYKKVGASTAIEDDTKLNDASKPYKNCFCLGKLYTDFNERSKYKSNCDFKRVLRKILQVQKSSKHVNKHKKAQIKHKNIVI